MTFYHINEDYILRFLYMYILTWFFKTIFANTIKRTLNTTLVFVSTTTLYLYQY